MNSTIRAGFACLAIPTVLAAQGPLRITTETIAPGYIVISGYSNGNILAVLGADGILLVDAQSAKRVAQADSALRTFSRKPVRWVINTHYHGDHIEGNAWYRERGAELIAHERVAVEARRDTTIKELEWHRTPAVAAALPTRTFRDTLTVAFSAGKARLEHPEAAHTGGDAVVWFPEANIVHVGDIVEIGAPPFMDWWGGGTLDGMIAAVDEILRRADARTRIVPGHGPVIGRSEVEAYRHMLVTVRDRLTRALATGKTLEQVHADRITAEFDAAMGGEGQTRRFVAILYLGLSRPG